VSQPLRLTELRAADVENAKSPSCGILEWIADRIPRDRGLAQLGPLPAYCTFIPLPRIGWCAPRT
jgi:hypothetical protein